MINFKKYSSIDNVITRDFMERVWAEMPADLEWVVQEKVHGANTSFLCDGEEVRFAKRTSVLSGDENFYDFLSLLEAYVTENRLNNVISHIGEVTLPKDFGKIMGMFSKDILEDYMKEHGGAYTALDKCEQKSLNRELNKLSTGFVKEILLSKAYIIP